MEKNTTNKLLILALILFAVMWLWPKNQGPATTPQEENEQAQAATEQNILAADTLGAQEMKWLVSNLREQGVKGADLQYTYAHDGVNLTVTPTDSIYGTVKVGDKEIDWHDVVPFNPERITIEEQQEAMQTVKALNEALGRYGAFTRFLSGDNKVVNIQNDVLALQISSRSGSITRAELKDYYTEFSPNETEKVKKNVVLFEGSSNLFDFELPANTVVNTAELYFEPREVNDSTVLMALDFGNGAFWGLRYTVHKGSYLVSMTVEQKGLEQEIRTNNTNLVMNWHQDLRRQEKGKMFEERNSAIYFKKVGGSVDHLSENKNDKKDVPNELRWIGFKNQFFSTVVIGRQPFAKANFESEVLKEANPLYLKNMNATATVGDYKWIDGTAAGFDIFMGPNAYPLLSHLDKEVEVDENMNMTKMIPLGWTIFRWINTLIIIPVFDLLSKFISNYGIIILLLTLFIKLVLFPFTWKSYKSQAKMRVLAPDIKAINEKYPGPENMQKRQQKTMELYSKAGASPFSGCLPMLLQMPILFAMFTFFPSCIELRGESFLWVHDLSAPDAIISWSGNIPLVTKYFGNHISLFCLLMTVTNVVYTYINMQNQSQTMPGMKWMMYLMPVMFMVFFNNYAAGLSYYYFLSLLITIIQTYAFRFVIKEEDVRKEMAENAKKPKKKSGFMARLEAAQKEQQRLLAEQQKRKK